MIDLRSDTLTRPTAAMRRAMAEAEVGDDVFAEDPTVRTLEEETAELLGTETAVYVPSGHMANQLGLYTATRSGEEVWAHEQHHLIGNEQAAAAVLSRVQPRLYSGDPWPDDALLRSWYAGAHQGDVHRAEPTVVWWENTFSGLVVPLAEQHRVTAFAHARGMRTHLDGARLWNAAAALGVPHARLAEGFDTVSVCFSKGLGAPVGSVLAGGTEVVRRARRGRKLLGGGMRQAGIVAAGALHALRHHRDRVVEDHARAATLAERIHDLPGITARARTNMVLVGTPEGRAGEYAEAFARHGVRALGSGDRVRLVVHLDVTDRDIEEAARAISEAVRELGHVSHNVVTSSV